MHIYWVNFIRFKHQFDRKTSWGSFIFSIFEYCIFFYPFPAPICSRNLCGLPPNFSSFTGYLSDDGSPRRTRQTDMSVFRDAVEDCLDFHPEPVKKAPNLKKNEVDVEKFSSLRIRWV